MKKLKLDFKNVGEILTREQLKQIVGGGTCAVYLPSGWTATGELNWDASGSGQSSDMGDGNIGSTWILRGISRTDADNLMANTAGDGRQWCCDSCASASWY
ncbi:hypothetical protein GCM10011386_30530 [Parapedobacter defluvii]|uniref:Bacteriocin-type signal sequence-containing protein n=1 Tax=Parapedobacter defluvii TaxID=2045106 RepID=A0ABQ1M848_9SPHI|nr:hypothetical protein GCM10011386_30530 [Parapedobacter defluvii]